MKSWRTQDTEHKGTEVTHQFTFQLSIPHHSHSCRVEKILVEDLPPVFHQVHYWNLSIDLALCKVVNENGQQVNIMKSENTKTLEMLIAQAPTNTCMHIWVNTLMIVLHNK